MLTKEEAINVIQRLKNCVEHDACEITNCEYFHKLDDLIRLEEFVMNSFPIVRCNECKWCYEEDGTTIRKCSYQKANKQVFDIFFCFGGERKDEQSTTATTSR